MEGNTSSKSSDIQYALRITFGIVHGVIITLFSFGFALFLPCGFALFGCILTPLLSLALTIFCNGCIEYVSQSSLNVTRILKTAWIPPLGVFCANIILLPLEVMPALGFTGPMHGLIAISILVSFILTTILQVYAARDVQDGYSDVPK